MVNIANKILLDKLINEVWNKGNLDVVNEVVADRYTIHRDSGDPWEKQVLDHETFKQRVMLARNVFPDLQFIIDDYVCEDNKIAISWQYFGTQRGDVATLKGSDKKVLVSGLTIYFFESAKITGHKQVLDRLGLFEQLGVKIGKQ